MCRNNFISSALESCLFPERSRRCVGKKLFYCRFAEKGTILKINEILNEMRVFKSFIFSDIIECNILLNEGCLLTKMYDIFI